MLLFVCAAGLTFEQLMSFLQTIKKKEAFVWGHSSAGRASDLHSEGRRFDPCCLHQFSNVSNFKRRELLTLKIRDASASDTHNNPPRRPRARVFCYVVPKGTKGEAPVSGNCSYVFWSRFPGDLEAKMNWCVKYGDINTIRSTMTSCKGFDLPTFDPTESCLFS